MGVITFVATVLVLVIFGMGHDIPKIMFILAMNSFVLLGYIAYKVSKLK